MLAVDRAHAVHRRSLDEQLLLQGLRLPEEHPVERAEQEQRRTPP